MKIAISYPPLGSEKGIPYLGQNRQFQWAHDPWSAYPIVPAYAATMLKEAGYGVVWLDGIAGEQSYKEWLEEFKREKPDLIMMETKTPVIKRHWKIINSIKYQVSSIKAVLVGDHVTALPEESFKKSKVDYVLTGGDYDFLLLNLVKHLTKKEKLEPGIYYRDGKKVKNTGKFLLNHDLNSLPFIDRELTKWELYAYKNSNYKRTPGTYIMAGRDCWWRKAGGCKFCFTKNTQVLTSKGNVLISSLVGSEKMTDVLTHTGAFQPIIKRGKRSYAGDIVKLHLYHIGIPLELTPDHAVYSLKRSSMRRCSRRCCWDYFCRPNLNYKRLKCPKCKRKYYRDYKLSFTSANQLEKGDFVAVPILREVNDKKEIKVDELLSFKKHSLIIKNQKIKCKRGYYTIPNKILLSKDFLRLVGFYLSEGHVHKSKNRPNSYTLCFTFSEKENRCVESVKKTFKKTFGLELNLAKNKKNRTIQLYIGSSILGKIFTELFGTNSYNKHLPEEWLSLPIRKQSELIKSIFLGDAHLRKRTKGSSGSEYILSIVSPALARQIMIMLFRQGFIPSYTIRTTRKWKHKADMHNVTLSHFDTEALFRKKILPVRKYNYRLGFVLDNYVMIPIKKIEKEKYDGFVYNLEIKNDHSFVANYIAVKNCSWTTLYPTWNVRKPENVLDEIGRLIEKYQVREIMDDTGTFPAGKWLREFCQGMMKRGYNKKIYFDCNTRFGVLTKNDYQLMAKAGFRLLLYGLESANQETVDRLNKGIMVDGIEKELRIAKEANREVGGSLEPHVTCMVGYPWETKKQAQKTIDLSKWLFDQGYIDTLQATIVIPYPGTALFAEAEKNGWLKTKNWDRYDMREPVMKTLISDEEIMALVRGIYSAFWTPKFVWRKLKEGLTSWDRFKYYVWFALKYFSREMDFRLRRHKRKSLTSELGEFFWRAGRAILGHLADFARK